MAKKNVGTWIIRTDGSKANEKPLEDGKPVFVAVNGRNFDVKVNEPFEPTQEELDVLQDSHYNRNGHLQRYDEDRIEEKDTTREDAEAAARAGEGPSTVQMNDLPAPETNTIGASQSSLKN